MTHRTEPERDAAPTRERRAYVRSTLPVRARISGSDGSGADFKVHDVSGNGVAVLGAIDAPVGEHVDVAIDYIGSGTARVVRKDADQTALEFLEGDSPLRQRRIRWHGGDNVNRRRHQRVGPQPKGNRRIVAPVLWPDGTRLEADVLDISAGGMKLAHLPAREGDALTVAGVPSTVVRVSEDATAIAFTKETHVRRLMVFSRSEPSA